MISERDASLDELQGCREESVRYILKRTAKIEERKKRADECEEQTRKMAEDSNGEAGA